MARLPSGAADLGIIYNLIGDEGDGYAHIFVLIEGSPVIEVLDV